MDLHFFATFALILSLLFLFLKKSKKPKAERLPPSPPKLPIIGHMHLVSSLPHCSFRDLTKKYGPIVHLKLGETSTIIVSSPKIAKEILKTQDPIFAARSGTLALEIISYNLTALSFSPYNEYWKQMRKICILELLSAKQVKFYGSIRNDEVLNLIHSIESSAGKPINLTEKVISAMSSTTCRAAFGKVCRDKETFIKIMIDALVLSGGFDLADLYPSSKILKTLSWNKLKLLAMRRKLDEILDSIIAEHKENYARTASNIVNGEMDQTQDSTRRGNGEFGNEDLVDVFLRLKESGELKYPIDDDNIKAVISEMFSAGTDPTSSTINWAMAELMKNPRVMAKAQAEVREAADGDQLIGTQNLKYLNLVIKETLRLHPPVPLIPRACREECEIDGYLIPANARVFVNGWEMGRDPKYWASPECFEPERFENSPIDLTGNNFEYLPFGAGRRMCPGLMFGLTSVELTLAQLLNHFDWKLPKGINPDNLDMSESAGMIVWKKEDLFLVATPHA